MNFMSSQVTRTDRREDGREHNGLKISLSENMRGLVVLVAASAALVAIAYGAMVALTAPGGWATQVADSAIAADTTTSVLTSWTGAPPAQ